MTLLWSVIVAIGLVASPAKGQEIPTVFEAGHFFVMLETTSGQPLKLLVDTGGGGVGNLYLLNLRAVSRLRLPSARCAFGSDTISTVELPIYKQGRGVPQPFGACAGAMAFEDAHPISFSDGLLGSNYLNGRIWTFDYPAKKLLLQRGEWLPTGNLHAGALGFQRDASGRRINAFPRIVIRVDGQPLDMLLDTGATAMPSDTGAHVTGTSTVNGVGVTSYITSSQLERWHASHPEWRVLENGDKLFSGSAPRMIEVPSVELAGWLVGPLWFTERADANFHDMMGSMMDKPPEGAVGGNLLQHFVMTIDYPKGVAYFDCAQGCRAARSAATDKR